MNPGEIKLTFIFLDATSSATSAKTFEGVGNATIDFVAVHCAEQYIARVLAGLLSSTSGCPER